VLVCLNVVCVQANLQAVVNDSVKRQDVVKEKRLKEEERQKLQQQRTSALLAFREDREK
jgi:hypothetical protein